jgi:hypothetical protein
MFLTGLHLWSESADTMAVFVPTAGEAPQREQLYHDIAAAQARLTAAMQRRSLALKDLNRAKQELERPRGLAKGSKATKQRLAEAAAAEAEWLARPGAAGTLGMIAGPLSKQVGQAAAWCTEIRCQQQQLCVLPAGQHCTGSWD